MLHLRRVAQRRNEFPNWPSPTVKAILRQQQRSFLLWAAIFTVFRALSWSSAGLLGLGLAAVDGLGTSGAWTTGHILGTGKNPNVALSARDRRQLQVAAAAAGAGSLTALVFVALLTGSLSASTFIFPLLFSGVGYLSSSGKFNSFLNR
jgi:hypothetical protein